MCYNCGCGLLEDDMGKGKLSNGGGSLTEEDIQHMAKKWQMTVEDTKRNILEQLKQDLD